MKDAAAIIRLLLVQFATRRGRRPALRPPLMARPARSDGLTAGEGRGVVSRSGGVLTGYDPPGQAILIDLCG